MILLSPEEMLIALNKNPFNCARHISLADGYCDELRALANEQALKIADWGNERCKEHSNDGWRRRECPKCWQGLLDEVK